MKVDFGKVLTAVLIALLTASIPAAIKTWADLQVTRDSLASTRAEVAGLKEAVSDLKTSIAVLDERGRRNHPEKRYLKVEEDR